MTDGYVINPPDEPYYRRVIQREKDIAQGDFGDLETNRSVRCVMIVKPPLRFDPGHCAVVRRDPYYPYCYEISVLGYPGFGVLNFLRCRIGDEFFSFSRNAPHEEIVRAFPVYWRDKMRVTGGNIPLEDGTHVSTGRLFIGFTEIPQDFWVAETDDPPEGSNGYDDLGFPLPPDKDSGGFPTDEDSRVTARKREVPFLLAEILLKCWTLVDTSVPSPIASGALAYAAVVPSIGLSLISVEPRVYQELTGVFTTPVSTDDVEDNDDDDDPDTPL